jgi:branched-chain amino acid transport system substrate-binding protein
MLFTVSGADSITQLPHLGFIARTQPNSVSRSRSRAVHAAAGLDRHGLDRAADALRAKLHRHPRRGGGRRGIGIQSLIYEADKSTYRSEVDTILRANPDFIMLGGYAADSTVVLRDLWQAGYEGRIIAPAYAVNPSCSRRCRPR